MKPSVIQSDNLTKFYGKRRGIQGVGLRVEAGEIFGYLGPNAAGKTTTIRVMMDLIRPSSGSVRLFGLDSRNQSAKIRKRVGYLPGELALYQNLRVIDILKHFSYLRQNVHWGFVEELSERLHCDLFHPVRTLSHGNRQKVGVIQAMMHKPELLILDEPTSGLDPLIRQEFYQLVREFKAEGKTVFISSHVLPEVERICDRAGIIRGGQLVAIEDVTRLKKKKIRQVEMTVAAPVDKHFFSDIDNIDSLRVENTRIRCRVIGDMDPLIKRIAGLQVIDFSSQQPGLEEIFLAYYGATEDVS